MDGERPAVQLLERGQPLRRRELSVEHPDRSAHRQGHEAVAVEVLDATTEEGARVGLGQSVLLHTPRAVAVPEVRLNVPAQGRGQLDVGLGGDEGVFKRVECEAVVGRSS